MPNPYHFRARMDRLWQCANSNARGYKKLKALNTIVREMYAPTERARQNLRMWLATDPYEVARHLLRDLHDRACLFPSPPAGGGGRGHEVTEGGSPRDEESPDEDDDPL